MNRLVPILLVVALLIVEVAAQAATPIDAARAEVARTGTQARELKTRQGTLKQELDQLGARIEALKAQQRGSLLTGGELESSLRTSQELSAQLTELASQIQFSEEHAGQASLALMSALSDELNRLRAQWEQAPSSDERRQLLTQLRPLRAERDRLRAALPAAGLPTLSPATSDDPEDLLEQADALRDSEDKVRKRLSALQARISEAREERELDRRMNEFAGQASLFDEDDRRLRLGQDPHATVFGSREVVADMASGPMAGPSAPTATGTRTGTSNEARAPDGMGRGGIAAGPAEELAQLEAERAQLQKLAEQLKAKAQELEAKARELK